MGKALYRKYRSKKLSELVGQEHITRTLGQAIKSGRVSHAYLFTGPRGVGKTSAARILAHEVNRLPYQDDSSHIDIIEIDAASNNGVEHVRDLREKAFVTPTSAPYKIYIIDEVHMLSKPAFNALLKTLEEPPAHVIFILATTEVHKLPETIVSRTQRFSFRPVAAPAIASHLRFIAEQEKINITDAALALIAEHGQGSFRDSISLLDQARHSPGQIDVAQIQDLLGLPPERAVQNLLDQLSSFSGSLTKIFSALEELYAGGYQAAVIARQLGKLLRGQLIATTAPLGHAETLTLLAKLIEVPASREPERLLEIVLLSAGAQTIPQAAEPNQAKATPSKAAAPSPGEKPTAAKTASRPEKAAKSPAKPYPKKSSRKTLDADTWQQSLVALKLRHNTLYSFARVAQANFSPGQLELVFAFAFHSKRVGDSKNLEVLSDVIEETTGQQVEITCRHDSSLAGQLTPTLKEAAEPKLAPEEPLSTISNIFGGGELLES